MSEKDPMFPSIDIGTEDNLSPFSVPRLLVTSTAPGVGLSTIFLGLLVALKRKRMSVGVAKIGTSLIDTTNHRRVAGHLSHTIDSWLLDKEQATHSFVRSAGGAEIVMVEGSAGIYEPNPEDFSLANEYEVAKALSLPIVLVIDTRSFRKSIAALVQGLVAYQTGAQIVGVIANWLEDEEHESVVEKALLEVPQVTYLGGIFANDPMLPSVALGTSIPGESVLTRNALIALGELVGARVDIEALSGLAAQANSVSIKFAVLTTSTRKCRIAVADDAAFHLVVQDNLDLLRRNGAELVPFSPLADVKLPEKISGVYLPHGYIKEYIKDLHANNQMRGALKEFGLQGGVMFAEGDAFAYLCRKLTLADGSSYDGVGLLSANASAIAKGLLADGFQYVDVNVVEGNFFSPLGETLKGFRRPQWAVRFEHPMRRVWEILPRNKDGTSVSEPVSEGFLLDDRVLATSTLLHWGASPWLAERFVASAVRYQKQLKS